MAEKPFVILDSIPYLPTYCYIPYNFNLMKIIIFILYCELTRLLPQDPHIRRAEAYGMWWGTARGWGWVSSCKPLCLLGKVRGKVEGMAESGLQCIVPSWICMDRWCIFLWISHAVFPWSTMNFFFRIAHAVFSGSNMEIFRIDYGFCS